MVNQRSVSIKPEQLLSLSANALAQTFYEAPRDQAKQLYKEIEKGKQASLFQMRLSNGHEIRGDVTLDKSEFVGRCSFSAFRTALGVMINRIATKLNAKEDLNIMSSKQSGELLFNIPGFVEQQGQLNLMVLSVTHRAPGVVLIRLMFLDPEQFKKT